MFTRGGDGAVRFHPGRAPSREEIADVAGRVAKRMTKWLRRRKLLDERPAEERSNEAPEVSALEACMQLSLFGATFLRVGGGVVLDADDDHRRGRKRSFRVHRRKARARSKALDRVATGEVGHLFSND